MISEYVLGDSSQHWSTYYERLRRDRYRTPLALRQIGMFLELPYSRLEESMTNSRMALQDLWTGQRFERFMAAYGPTLEMRFDQIPPSDGAAIDSLHEKWRNTDLSLNMYLSPEGRESVQMMGDAMLRVANSARSLKRGDFGGFVRNLHELPRSDRRRAHRRFSQGDLSGAFLSAHLGWTPLIKDVYELSDIEPPAPKATRIRGSAKGRARSFYVNSPRIPCSLEVRKSSFRVSILGDVSRQAEWQERFGLNNPFATAWELVPLSFVADYFLPIGQTISNMGFISAARFAQMWRKHYEESSAVLSVPAGTLVNDGGWQNVQVTRGASVYRRFADYRRTPYELTFASPLRGLSGSLPTSLMRLATISALTHQRILSLR